MIKGAPAKFLRTGWTTGACAAAGAAGAYEALLSGRFPDSVTITLPRGERPVFPLARFGLGNGCAFASVVKDSGDDPDITHGAEIVSTVKPGQAGSGLVFLAGEGVGTVTLPGLPLKVGEPAINPGPRAMIKSALLAIAARYDGGGQALDLSVAIAIPGGLKLAKKTMNQRLGIKGGLSILGVHGVVIPYSCSAWVEAIHRGVDVARALNLDHIAAATGRASEAGVRALHGLPMAACIEMGGFGGALLKYLRGHPVSRLTIAGGFAKMAKLAQGSLDLHSSRSKADLAALAEMLDGLGAPPEMAKQARSATTAARLLQIAGKLAPDLAKMVASGARETALAALAGRVEVDAAIFDRAGKLICCSDD